MRVGVLLDCGGDAWVEADEEEEEVGGEGVGEGLRDGVVGLFGAFGRGAAGCGWGGGG